MAQAKDRRQMRAHDDGYDQELVLWVEAYGRENAVAKAMIDQPLIADSELASIEVIATEQTRPDDWNIIRDKDRGDWKFAALRSKRTKRLNVEQSMIMLRSCDSSLA